MKKINEFILCREACKLLGVSRNSIIRWEKEGKIKVIRNPMNNYRLYDKGDIDRFLAYLQYKQDVRGK